MERRYHWGKWDNVVLPVREVAINSTDVIRNLYVYRGVSSGGKLLYGMNKRLFPDFYPRADNGYAEWDDSLGDDVKVSDNIDPPVLGYGFDDAVLYYKFVEAGRELHAGNSVVYTINDFNYSNTFDSTFEGPVQTPWLVFWIILTIISTASGALLE